MSLKQFVDKILTLFKTLYTPGSVFSFSHSYFDFLQHQDIMLYWLSYLNKMWIAE